LKFGSDVKFGCEKLFFTIAYAIAPFLTKAALIYQGWNNAESINKNARSQKTTG
jgi:hypothetical protein